MALVVYDRVQETTSTTGTGSITLAGAVAGFQSFAVIGNGNTTFYTIVNGNQWEVGLGTYSTTGPTLARTTVYSNSNGNTSPITLSGSSVVFVTYPAGKSVNLDDSGNVSPLGTIASGTWQGTTVGVAYGGTGVTSSSGANSVMLRDANQNVAINRLNQSNTNTTAVGGTTALTTASSYSQTLVGTGGQTYTLPDATTLTTGVAFLFNNRATGTLTLQDYATGSLGTITAGGAGAVFLTDNSTVGGTWDVHGYLPEGVTWGTNALNLGTTVISNGTWQGGTIQPAYGGTGLTTFSAANYALYSTSASALTAGTLPVAAGGTGTTTSTGTAGSVVLSNNPTLAGLTDSGNLTFTGTGNRITGDFSNATAVNRVAFQNSVTNAQTILTIIPNGTSVASALAIEGDSAVANGPLAALNLTSTDVRLTSGGRGTFSFLPMTFYTGGSERLRIDTSGNVGIGTFTTSIAKKLSVVGEANFTDASNNTRLYTGFGTIPGTGGTGAYLYNNDNTPLVFGTSNTERMRIDSSGNLILGTTAVAAAEGYRFYKNYGRYDNGTFTGFIGSGTSLGSAAASDFSIRSENALAFMSGGATERMRIDSSGNVGIGLAGGAAAGKFEVGGGRSWFTANSEPYSVAFRYNSGTGVMYMGATNSVSTPSIQFSNSGGSALATIDYNGNVGIGTSSPGKNLDVAGTGRFSGTVDVGGGLNLTSNGSQVTTTYGGVTTSRFYTSTSGANISVDGSWPIIFTNASTERMRITSAGGISFGSSGTAYGVQNAALISNGDTTPTWNQVASLGSFFYQTAFMGGF